MNTNFGEYALRGTNGHTIVGTVIFIGTLHVDIATSLKIHDIDSGSQWILGLKGVLRKTSCFCRTVYVFLPRKLLINKEMLF